MGGMEQNAVNFVVHVCNIETVTISTEVAWMVAIEVLRECSVKNVGIYYLIDELYLWICIVIRKAMHAVIVI